MTMASRATANDETLWPIGCILPATNLRHTVGSNIDGRTPDERTPRVSPTWPLTCAAPHWIITS